MALWKVDGNKAKPVDATSFKDQDILETKVEDWVASNPEILGEPLLVIGRQVVIHELNDRIDLLALDRQGNVVVIEVKREDISAPVDIQGLRYASYVAGWKTADLERVATNYLGEDADEFSLLAQFSSFADWEGADVDVPINDDQRVIIVGQRVKNRLGSVALWLREKGVDIKLVELRPFLDGTELYLEPMIIIPPPSTDKWEKVGSRVRDEAKPWLADGEAWHRKRGGEDSFQRLQKLASMMLDKGITTKISYSQKYYVSVYSGRRSWMKMRNHVSVLMLFIPIGGAEVDLGALASELDLVVFDVDSEMSEKLATPSSIALYERRGGRELTLRLKPDYDIESAALMKFLKTYSKKKRR